MASKVIPWYKRKSHSQVKSDLAYQYSSKRVVSLQTAQRYAGTLRLAAWPRWIGARACATQTLAGFGHSAKFSKWFEVVRKHSVEPLRSNRIRCSDGKIRSGIQLEFGFALDTQICRFHQSAFSFTLSFLLLPESPLPLWRFRLACGGMALA